MNVINKLVYSGSGKKVDEIISNTKEILEKIQQPIKNEAAVIIVQKEKISLINRPHIVNFQRSLSQEYNLSDNFGISNYLEEENKVKTPKVIKLKKD